MFFTSELVSYTRGSCQEYTVTREVVTKHNQVET